MKDAEAIYKCGIQPDTKFVKVKTEDEQTVAMLHTLRQACIKTRIEISNRIRSILNEFGIIVAQGKSKINTELKRMFEAAVSQFSDLRITHERLMDARARMECLLPLRQLDSDYRKNIAEVELFKDAISSFEGYAAGIAVKELSANCKEYNKQLEQLIAKDRVN